MNPYKNFSPQEQQSLRETTQLSKKLFHINPLALTERIRSIKTISILPKSSWENMCTMIMGTCGPDVFKKMFGGVRFSYDQSKNMVILLPI